MIDAGAMYGRIASRVRLLRLSRGWRQVDLATALGWSRGEIAHIEHGRRSIAIEHGLHLASTLGVELVELYQ